MRYSDQDLIQALAVEYVIGTLRGKARDRFESLKASREDMQQAVRYWESQLNEMVLALDPQAPREEVLIAIREKLALNTQGSNSVQNASNVIGMNTPSQASEKTPDQNSSTPQKGSKDSNKVYKWALAFSVAACIMLSVFSLNLLQQIDSTEQAPTALVIFEDAESQVLWTLDLKLDEVRIRPTEFLTQQANNDYQLWIVPKSGAAPISIGLLPQKGELTIKQSLALGFNDIEALAVSLEPLGGSPTCQPTTVLFAASLISVNS